MTYRMGREMQFCEWKVCLLIWISPKFVPKGPIDNKPPLVQVMDWCRTGDKPSSELMLTQLTDAYMQHGGGGGGGG